MKTISITPKNERVKIMADMVKLHNDMVGLGYKTRQQFVNVVGEIMPEYRKDEKKVLLVRWWNFRVVDKTLNFDIRTVILNLKAE